MTKHWTRYLPNVSGPLDRIATEIEKKKAEHEQGRGTLNVLKYIEYLEEGASACARTHWPADQIKEAKEKAALDMEVLNHVVLT